MTIDECLAEIALEQQRVTALGLMNLPADPVDRQRQQLVYSLAQQRLQALRDMLDALQRVPRAPWPVDEPGLVH